MSKFVSFANLNPEQFESAGKRWAKLEGFEYQFSQEGKPIARRKAERPAAKPEAAPAPAKKPRAKKSEPAAPVATPAPEVPAVAVLPIEEHPHAAELPNTPALDGVTSFIAPAAPTSGERIEALIESLPDGNTPPPAAILAPVAATLVLVPLVCMIDSPTQPRTHYDATEHEELTASFRQHGWLSSFPALLRPLAGPAAVAAPVDPNNTEGPWTLLHPDTRANLNLGNFSQEEAEGLAATKYAKRYEIVFAHRRTRAARAAGLTEAPAEIRELSDVEVLELQLIENAQRSDLNLIEESEHLARLLALRDSHGQPLHTKETLARRLGKTAEHVRTCSTLCRLDGDARAAVANGTLGLAIAIALARIPDAETRDKAAKEILNPTQGEGPMRMKAALDYIRRECTRNLRTEAKFPTDDADLVPVRHKIDPETPEKTVRYFGGACTDCPYNSACSVDDPLRTGPRLGVCSNLACFDQKQTAGFEKWRAQHHQPDKGKVAVTAERNAELFDAEGELNWQSGLVPLNQAPDAGLLKTGAVVGEQTWKDLTKGKLGEVIVARDPKTGKKVELIDVEAAKSAAELNGFGDFKTSKAARIPNTEAGDAAHKAQTLDAKKEQETRRRVESEFLGEVAHKAVAREHLPPDGWSHLCKWVVGIVTLPALEAVAKRRGVEVSALAALATNATTPEQIGLVCELIVADHYKNECIDLAAAFAEVFGIDLAAIRERARVAVEPPPAPAAAFLPHGENWRATRFTPSPIKSDFDFEAPDVVEVQLPTQEPLKVELQTACALDLAGVEHWFAGYVIAGGRLAVISPCHRSIVAEGTAEPNLAGFPTRFTAYAIAARDVAARLDAEETVSQAVRDTMRAVAAGMRDFAGAELYVQRQDETGGADIFGEAPADPTTPAEPLAPGEPAPAFLAYLTANSKTPKVKPYIAADYDECLKSAAVVWVCPLAGVSTMHAAELAAAEALQFSAGTVTEAGEAANFTFASVNGEEAL